MGMIARGTNADVNVIGLIGERGREVREFIEKDLGPEGLKRSVVVVVTSDASPLLKIRAAKAVSAIAEYFSATGQNVLLMMDSITVWRWLSGKSLGHRRAPDDKRVHAIRVFSSSRYLRGLDRSQRARCQLVVFIPSSSMVMTLTIHRRYHAIHSRWAYQSVASSSGARTFSCNRSDHKYQPGHE